MKRNRKNAEEAAQLEQHKLNERAEAIKTLIKDKKQLLIFEEWDARLCHVGDAKFRKFLFEKENSMYRQLPMKDFQRARRFTQQKRLEVLDFTSSSRFLVSVRFFQYCLYAFSIGARRIKELIRISLEVPIGKLSFDILYIISKFFSVQRKLKSLEINISLSNGMSYNFYYFFRVLRKLRSLKSLKLKSCNYSFISNRIPKSIRQFQPFSSLQQLENLSIDLSLNKLRDTDILDLIAQIGNLANLKSLQLFLSNNKLGNPLAISIGEQLKELMKLEQFELDLTVNTVGREGINALAETAKILSERPSIGLVTINVRFNSCNDKELLHQYFQRFRNNPKFTLIY